MKVAVLGAAGGIGQALALLLKLQLPAGSDLALYDIAPVTPGVAVDVSHIPTAVSVKGFSGEDPTPALEGADVVMCTILSGSTDVWRYDIEIPAKYGVDICVGDTRGPSGIFRFLRTAPAMAQIAQDMEKICPNAVLLNYTNPMAMLCNYLQKTSPITVTGLCHSVQGTAQMLAEWIGAPYNEIDYTCAGINHQAWYLDFKWKGKDAYPLIKEALKKRAKSNKDKI